MAGELTEVQKQAAEFYRHYSNLRFAMLTVFTAVSAGLINIFFSTNVKLAGIDEMALRTAGVALAIVFGVYQGRLAVLIGHYQSKLPPELAGPGGENMRCIWLWTIPLLILFLHLASAVFWIAARP